MTPFPRRGVTWRSRRRLRRRDVSSTAQFAVAAIVRVPSSPAHARTMGHLTRRADELAGIIVEPRPQGAGGMHVYDLQVLRDLADEHDLLLAFDEIATGFGRTGDLFVGVRITLDALCLGKAPTGGYLTSQPCSPPPRSPTGSPPASPGAEVRPDLPWAIPWRARWRPRTSTGSSNGTCRGDRVGRPRHPHRLRRPHPTHCSSTPSGSPAPRHRGPRNDVAAVRRPLAGPPRATDPGLG